jgi:hypothetical protein
MGYDEQQKALTPPVQQKGGTQTTGPQVQAPRKLNMKKGVAQKLGAVDSLSSATSVIGGVLDAMAPTAGEGFEGSVEVEIKPPAGVGFYMKLGLNGAVKRLEDGRLEVEGKTELTVGIAGEASIDTGWFGKYGGSWHAGVKGAIGVKATGDSGAHCMQLFGLGIHDWVKACPGGAYVASKLFGGTYEADVLKTMKPEGHAKESSLEYSAELGLDVGAGLEAGDDNKIEAEGGIAGTVTNKVTKDKDGKRKDEVETATVISVALGGESAAFGGSGEAELTLKKGQKPDLSLSLELTPKSLDGKAVAYVAKGLADLIKPLLKVASKAAPDEKTRTALAVGCGWLPSQLIAEKIDATKGMAMGYGLGLNYENGAFKSWDLSLTREVEVEVGPLAIKGKTSRELASGEAKEEKAPVKKPTTPPPPQKKPQPTKKGNGRK